MNERRVVIKMELETTSEVEQKESLKLIKNTKGYNWEIKLLEINPDKIEEINNLMISKFNKEENQNATWNDHRV